MKKELKHYWICEPCANKLGGVFPHGHCCTVMMDICKYCELPIKQTVIPWVDFDWPKDKGTDFKAKVNRD